MPVLDDVSTIESTRRWDTFGLEGYFPLDDSIGAIQKTVARTAQVELLGSLVGFKAEVLLRNFQSANDQRIVVEVKNVIRVVRYIVVVRIVVNVKQTLTCDMAG